MEAKIQDEVLFQSIFESSVEGILVVDENGTIVRVNPALEDLFGYENKELVSRKVEMLIPYPFRKKHINLRNNFQNDPSNRRMGMGMDLWGLKKDGSKFPLEISLSPLKIDSKQVIIAFISNISEHKRAALELEKEKKKLQKYIDTAASIFLVINKEQKIVLINQKGCEVLGWPCDEILNKNWFENFMPKKEKIKIESVFNDIILGKTEPPSLYENVILTKSKKRKLIQWRNTTLKDDHGQVEALLSSGVDITEQKRAERALRLSESKNRAILEAIPDVIFIHNKHGKTLEIHASDSSLMIVPAEKQIGKYVKHVLPNMAADKIMGALKKVHETKEMEAIEVIVPGIDKSIDFESRFVPFGRDKILSVARDISQGNALKKMLLIRNNALEAAGNGILISDARLPDMPIIYCNASFSKITGYSKDEVLGKNCRFLQNDDRDQEEIEIIRKAIQKGELCHVILRNYKKDDTLFWNELTITPVRNEQGVLINFIGVQNDVTLRKKEEILKDEMRKVLELIAKDNPLAVVGTKIIEIVEGYMENSGGHILLLDEEKETLNHLSASSLPKTFIEAMDNISVGESAGTSAGVTATQQKEVIVKDISKDPLWKDHRDIALEHGLKACWSFPLLSLTNNVFGTFTIYSKEPGEPTEALKQIISDMVQLASLAIERYRTKLALQDSGRQLEVYASSLEEKVQERTIEVKAAMQLLVETNLSLKDQMQTTKAAENRAMAGQALFTAIAKNFPNGVISVFNTYLEFVYVEGEELKRIELNKHDFEGKSIDDVPVLSKELKEKIKEDIQKTLSGKHLSFELEYVGESYSVNSIPLYADKNVTWALFVFSNITEQKQVQHELRKALETEKELNELKSRFISMASHEFRTPLSAISTSAILIDKQNDAGKTDKLKKYVQQIQQNVRNLVVILNDFLSLSKLEEGKLGAKPEYFDLVGLTKNLANELEPNLKRGQRIVIKENTKVIEAYLDPKLMQHILTNLISNAIKYSGEGHKIKIALKKKEQSIVIKVKDRGIGIPQEEQANLFQRFFRAGNSTNIQGTGLGLHIVQQYTELMGGKVGFKSKKDKGSTFWVEFPEGDGGE